MGQAGVHGLLHRGEEGGWHGAEDESVAEIRDTAAGRAGLDPQPDPGQKRVVLGVLGGHGFTGPHDPLDADGRGLPEGNSQTVLLGQGGLDDFFLYLAIEGHCDLGARGPDIDQWVLLGQFSQSLMQPRGCRAMVGDYNGFQGGRGKGRDGGAAALTTHRVADTGVSQAPDPSDPTGRQSLGERSGAAPDHADPGNRVLGPA